jgi:hypothetical protein
MILAWPLDSVRPGLPEWVSTLPALFFVPLQWYWVGTWVDRNLLGFGESTIRQRRAWLFILLFFPVCAVAATVSEFVGSYTSWLLFGPAIWLAAGLAIKASPLWSRPKSNRAYCKRLICLESGKVAFTQINFDDYPVN